MTQLFDRAEFEAALAEQRRKHRVSGVNYDDRRCGICRRDGHNARSCPDRPRIRIPDGKPRVVDGRSKLNEQARKAFYGSIVQAAKARLALLEQRSSIDKLACPWFIVETCTAACRCRGTGEVSVGLYRAHCRKLIADYARLA
jgi:hypothetical protein